MRSLRWNRQLLKYVGIWPLEISDPHFLFFFVYLLIHCSLTFADLTNHKNDLDEIVGNFTENVLFLMTLTKITVCRINGRSIRQLLIEIENNFRVDKYNSLEQKLIIMKYTKLARYYILVAVTSMTVAVGLYYVGGIIPNLKIAFSNLSLSYKLPYKTRAIIDIDDTRIYFCICLYQMLIIPTVVLGYVGFDCLFTNLAFNIIAQFGVLSYKIKEILDDYNSFRFNIKKLVFLHYRLIRQAECLEDNFHFVIMQQLMGTTFHLCITGYNVLIVGIKYDLYSKRL
ncbi:hypothetical protein M0804_013949 [Polistes exclamans]|nr:hypothetical protein M0804_013949 [Polistes exclamans]